MKKKKNKLIDIIELENKNFINQRVALVSREGHTISINEYYNQLLFPNLNSLVKIAYKKYKNNKIITESKEIVPFL